MTKFFIEMTDTFDDEANYCWVKRFTVDAKSFKGAVQKFASHVGNGWKINFDSGDMKRYDNGVVCIFIEEYDFDKHSQNNAQSI